MTLVVSKKERGSILPRFVEDILNTTPFFTPRMFNFNDMLDTETMLTVPEANIRETDKEFKLELAVPGMNKQDFKIEIENGILNVSAEKETEKKEEMENYRRREFSFNSFRRSFTLPENLFEDKIDAKYDNGILRLTLPKKEVTVSKKAKEIKIS